MKLSFRLKRVCGSVYSNGNVTFTPDGNAIISPVGNRVNIFDLVEQTSTTLPFENRKNIKRCAMSHNGRFLITVDIDGHALLINFPRQVILHRFHFKRKVHDIKFSPNDEFFAVTFGHGCQIWKTPGVVKEFAPLTLSRTIGGHNDDTTCLDWSDDSESIIMGSRDLSACIYYRVNSKRMAKTTLAGHRDVIRGTFFSKDGESAFTVAADGGVFTWQFEYGERIPINSVKKHRNASRQNSKHVNSDDGDEMSGEDSDSDTDSETQSDKRADVNGGSEGKSKGKSIEATARGSKWILASREFLWDPNTQVTSVAFNKSTKLLVVGFNKGVFGLYEMPGCVNIHKLSVSQYDLNTAAINASGDWLALGSAKLGQILIWEWQSESYVLKQQGHLYGLNAVDYSSDGQFIATGGDDAKVKLWSTSSGFCVVTFTEHLGPVSGVRFVGRGAGKAVVSCSLDGTVRAHDLLRYKNFRTLTTATPVQFTCVAADPSGEVICAGAMDPFNIYVWALQTGQLLEVLAGHEGPIACLAFAPAGSVLASGSWDGTLKVWDVYKAECAETFEHGCDVLSVAVRADGKEICTSAINGQLYFWDIESGAQVGVIEGSKDISGGRLSTDTMTADRAARSKHFKTVVYSADGSCVVAGGHSKFVCVYSVAGGALVKKFQLSHNRSLEGISEELRSDRFVDGVALDNLRTGTGQSDSEDEFKAVSMAPGGSRTRLQDGSRTTRPDILTSALCFAPTGREWATATTQGLQIFTLDDTMTFAPTDLDLNATPQEVLACVARSDYGRALALALQLSLSEAQVLEAAALAVPVGSIDLVVKSITARALRPFLKFLAQQLSSSQHTEFYLRWCWSVLRTFGPTMQMGEGAGGGSMALREVLRSLMRAVATHERESQLISDNNHFTLLFLCSQIERAVSSSARGEDGDEGDQQTGDDVEGDDEGLGHLDDHDNDGTALSGGGDESDLVEREGQAGSGGDGVDFAVGDWDEGDEITFRLDRKGGDVFPASTSKARRSKEKKIKKKAQRKADEVVEGRGGGADGDQVIGLEARDDVGEGEDQGEGEGDGEGDGNSNVGGIAGVAEEGEGDVRDNDAGASVKVKKGKKKRKRVSRGAEAEIGAVK